ncbi:hypothetical protein OsI_38241 [Oryza sativa Indica Group]|uniref:Uncharacterized protein n=1 Tax=Oryza sativa subsp. indica TaxID=39946 RepID=A2ZK87_ORYSI|nr:hypothetical protein OsI_38241 [Oryza sativa Indica Group]
MLAVECTGEGVVFVEAEADVPLEDFGEPLMPTFHGAEGFLCDVGDTRVIVGRPLFYMQRKLWITVTVTHDSLAAVIWDASIVSMGMADMSVYHGSSFISIHIAHVWFMAMKMAE